MTLPLRVDDVGSYLAGAGWQSRPEAWRSAAVWFHSEGAEVLVPARDGMADGDLRIRDLVETLAVVERRAVDEIVRDISSPLVDIQTYRIVPAGLPSGFVPLLTGLEALTAVRDLFVAAAGVESNDRSSAAAQHSDLLGKVQLGPSGSGSYLLTVRVPVAGDGAPPGPSGARPVLLRIHRAVTAFGEAFAVPAGREPDLDPALAAGGTAQVCEALARFSGPERNQPFDIAFRWARRGATPVPASIVRFPQGAGAALEARAGHLARASAGSDPATVTGLVDKLHDTPSTEDRWRAHLRGGRLTTPGGIVRRSLWLRFPDQATYDLAIRAHRQRRPLRAAGSLVTVGRRTEFHVRPQDVVVMRASANRP